MRHTLLLRNTLSSGKLRSRPVGYAGANAAGGGVNGSRLRPCSIHLRHDHLCRSCHVAELLDAQQPLRDPCRISRRKCRSEPRGRRACSGAFPALEAVHVRYYCSCRAVSVAQIVQVQRGDPGACGVCFWICCSPSPHFACGQPHRGARPAGAGTVRACR